MSEFMTTTGQNQRHSGHVGAFPGCRHVLCTQDSIIATMLTNNNDDDGDGDDGADGDGEIMMMVLVMVLIMIWRYI